MSYLKVVRSWVWVHIPEEKRLKLNIYSWQKIIIGYENKNQYRVYNPHIGKVHLTWDLFVDKQYLYYCEALNDGDYTEDDWTETDDTEFADADNFGSLDTDDFSNSVEENILK